MIRAMEVEVSRRCYYAICAEKNNRTEAWILYYERKVTSSVG